MLKSNADQKLIRPPIVVIRRPLSSSQHKVLPIRDEESHDIRPGIQETLPPVVPQEDTLYSEAMQYPSMVATEPTKTPAATPAVIKISTTESRPSNLTEPEKSSSSIKRWYRGLTPKQKTCFQVGIVATILLICSIIAALLVVFLIILRSSSATTTTTTTTMPTTTITSTFITAAWTFDQTIADTNGIYNGTLMNGASYSPVLTNQPYIGYGRALTLSAPLNQSFVVSAPFLNLTYMSFTVEAWIYSTNITNDRGIFSQCACSTCLNQCFYFIVRSGRLYADFTLNGVSGATLTSVNSWYHVAFVYNYATKQQILYLNGVQDGIASNANPYQGTNATIQIGAALISSATFFFNGYIDNMQLTTRAKSSTEILFDASVTAYYSFDLSALCNDNGPNGMNGSSTNTAIVAGRVNQAIHFSGSSSYFQAYGFYQLMYSISNKPFSVSFWTNPSAVANAAIVQITQQQSTGGCINFISITSATGAGLTGQLQVQGYFWPIIYGPFLTVNIWTHVSVTYSAGNGMTLYINGVLFGSTGAVTLSGSGYVTWLQIGYNFPITTGTGPNGGYQGSIDEFYVHSRELTQGDINVLANP